MKWFLIEYDRASRSGGIAGVYADGDVASAHAALRERERFRAPHEEVVLLYSDSEDTIRVTHARYFIKRAEPAQP